MEAWSLAVLIALYNMMRDKDKLRSVYDDLPLSTSTAAYAKLKNEVNDNKQP